MIYEVILCNSYTGEQPLTNSLVLQIPNSPYSFPLPRIYRLFTLDQLSNLLSETYIAHIHLPESLLVILSPLGFPINGGHVVVKKESDDIFIAFGGQHIELFPR